MIKSISRFAGICALLAALPAARADVNGFVTVPRVAPNGFPNSTLVITNTNTNPDTASISESNYGTGSGANRNDILASTDGGATAFTFGTNQGFKISTTFTLSDGADSPRKEAGIRINNSITGPVQFIVDSDAKEIVVFGGGAPFHSFGSGATGYTTGTPITLSMEYDPPGLVNATDGLMTYSVNYPTLGLNQSFSGLFSNAEGGPGANSTFGVYAQTGGVAGPADFLNANFTNISASLVPEPASLGVISLGLVSLLARRRRAR